ncbi:MULTISPECIES: ABC transporter ATP-binding protein [Mycobacteriaceae]|uniref:Fatty acid ABC transporter ATP-binding/permease protein n=1 Tax=Mycolicibacterium neoaurum VKM Ac-1815D TaxID=700508 RepID=V5XH99_MYCNE|nr:MULTISPECIES: ABC transporter ATP-binding protein [Mycobacteriaceae]AHC26779.1 ABC transporter ATP-binding protein [Mycolicibacterium neoaurum VKM Ac-1815D]AMO07085.1 ABC transporter ATP-binding protein [Mycolicibacterium neoaurum]AXK74543.1 ABC transporter ATP-binding protein [Mycolicibacterium neoaurum]KJQ50195.1 ABC transporter ATP-binding protein [Mycolicibacterium neoaurum]KUM06804.1 ABC transporter ATP-binding protein [Mycolicibacterium neoaurum]
MTRPARGMQPPTVRSRDFTGSALRLLKRLTPQRMLTATVIMLAVGGIAIGVIGPRILGHATDLLFDGVIGRGLPAGLSKEEAITAARARGDDTLADLLSGMNVVPGKGVDFTAVAHTLLLALGLYLVAALLVWLQARILNVVVQRTMMTLRAEIQQKVHRLPLSYVDGRQRGELLSRVTNDVDNVQSTLGMAISQLLTSALTVLAVLVAMLTISPLLTALTVLTVPLSLWATRAIARRSAKLFAEQWANTGRLNAHIEETYSGFTVVKTYGHRAAAGRQFDTLNGDVHRTSLAAQFLSGLVGPATTFIGNLSYVAVAVVGGIQVATGQITLGSIQAFIQYVRQFNQPLTQVAAMYNALQSGIASAERIFEVLDAEEEPSDAPPATRPVGPGRVRFERVSFGYRPDSPVIDELSLIAEPGTTVAIVGPTGAGKTTLVNLLMRFYDADSGRITIDDVDIATMPRADLRSRIGMVLQDTWLFSGTVYDNIAYGRPDAGADEVHAAARAAHVDRFVRTLPLGYQTRVGDDGGAISAGEKQLITIARAVLARPQLLILDEATSSVDTRTELLIQQAMAELRRDRTSFIIAHRLSTIRDADQILVMEAGRIVERGTHAELLARRGEYWEMAKA